jgi:hypothetical protein
MNRVKIVKNSYKENNLKKYKFFEFTLKIASTSSSSGVKLNVLAFVLRIRFDVFVVVDVDVVVVVDAAAVVVVKASKTFLLLLL